MVGLPNLMTNRACRMLELRCRKCCRSDCIGMTEGPLQQVRSCGVLEIGNMKEAEREP